MDVAAVGGASPRGVRGTPRSFFLDEGKDLTHYSVQAAFVPLLICSRDWNESLIFIGGIALFLPVQPFILPLNRPCRIHYPKSISVRGVAPTEYVIGQFPQKITGVI